MVFADATRLVVAFDQGDVCAIDLKHPSNRVIRLLAEINDVSVSPDGTQLAVAGNTPQLSIWSLVTGQPLHRFEHGTPAAGVAASLRMANNW